MTFEKKLSELTDEAIKRSLAEIEIELERRFGSSSSRPSALDHLKQLSDKATPGPYKAVPSIEWDFFSIYPDTGKKEFPIATEPLLDGKHYLNNTQNDFAFIVACVNYVRGKLFKDVQWVNEVIEAVGIAGECGVPTTASFYDEEGVEGWKWTHPDGREWTEVGAWDEMPALHPLLAELMEEKWIERLKYPTLIVHNDSNVRDALSLADLHIKKDRLFEEYSTLTPGTPSYKVYADAVTLLANEIVKTVKRAQAE